jgi:hypothetical protein
MVSGKKKRNSIRGTLSLEKVFSRSKNIQQTKQLTNMKTLTTLSLLLLPSVLGHQEHGHQEHATPADGEASYAERHVGDTLDHL